MTVPHEPVEAWTVRRRWAPRLGRETVWRRFRRRFSRTAPKMDASPDVFGEGLSLIVAILVLMFVVIPFVVALVDLLVLVLLALAGLAGRILFPNSALVARRR